MSERHTHTREGQKETWGGGEFAKATSILCLLTYLLTYLEKCLLDDKKNDKEEGRGKTK